jgi:hypothetical protein
MELRKDIYVIWRAVAEKYAYLHASRNDDDRRTATLYGIETLRARGYSTIVHKTQHSNLSAPSKDTLACVDGEEFVIPGSKQHMWVFDMINGETRVTHPHPIYGHEVEHYVLVPNAFDHLNGEVIEDPDGDDGDDGEDPPVVDDPLTDIRLRLLALEGKFDTLPPVISAQIADAIAKRLTVEVDVEPAGPKQKIFGISLQHDHTVHVSVLLDGQPVTRTVHRAKVEERRIPDGDDYS